MNKNNLFYLITSAILSILLTNLGAKIIADFPKQPYLGIAIIILAFLLIYFVDYFIRIKVNSEKIIKLEEEIIKIKQDNDADRKLLYTVRDCVLIKWRKQ